MKTKRLKLHEIFKTFVNNVYFRPPSKGMKYPCILYDYEGDANLFADDIKYYSKGRWRITVIDEDPDSEIPEKLKSLRYCEFDRPYQKDGLNHFVFTLYY